MRGGPLLFTIFFKNIKSTTLILIFGRAQVSRPPRFQEFNPEKIGCVDVVTDQVDFHYVLHVFDVATLTPLSLDWNSELWKDLRKRKNLTQVIAKTLF